jgi:hypothetical protein
MIQEKYLSGGALAKLVLIALSLKIKRDLLYMDKLNKGQKLKQN